MKLHKQRFCYMAITGACVLSLCVQLRRLRGETRLVQIAPKIYPVLISDAPLFSLLVCPRALVVLHDAEVKETR